MSWIAKRILALSTMTFSLDLPSIYARMYMAILFGDGGAAAKYNRLQFAGSLKRFFVSGLLNRVRGWKCWFVEFAWISDQCYVNLTSGRAIPFCLVLIVCGSRASGNHCHE